MPSAADDVGLLGAGFRQSRYSLRVILRKATLEGSYKVAVAVRR
jgi:hypothetical protein